MLIYSLSVSCSKPVDFDQINDFKIAPVMETSLVYINEPITRFLDGDDQVIVFQDYVYISFFTNEFIADNMIKAEFVFETTNTTNRPFEVTMDFLDINSQMLHTFSFQEASTSNAAAMPFYYTETFQSTSLTAFKKTSLVMFSLKILPNELTIPNKLGKISVKSKGVFYFNIDGNL